MFMVEKLITINSLCGYHAKDISICNWVISNYDGETNNITVKLWVEACKEYLKKVDTDTK